MDKIKNFFKDRREELVFRKSLSEMSKDPEILFELLQIENEFRLTEFDGIQNSETWLRKNHRN